jgi:1,4-alpha-glucan branching enzyme
MKGNGHPKILIVVNEFPPDIVAGTAMSTYYLSKYLAENGHDVHVAVTMRKNGSPAFERKNGVLIHRLNPVRVKGTRTAQCFARLYGLARTIRPDVIQGQAVSCGFLAALLGKILGIPSVTYIQGYDLYHAGRFQKATEVRFPLKHSSAILTVTEDLRRKSMDVFARRDAIVMPHGLETENLTGSTAREIEQEYPFLSGRSAILYIGQLNRRKGLTHLIDAMGILRGKRENAHLLLVGSGPEEETLRSRVRKTDLEDRVHFIDAVDHSRVLALMDAASLFVLPSLEEAFGIVLVEAMSQGLPIVASDVQGIPSIIQNEVNGYLVPPGDERALAERIIQLLDNESLAREMGERNRIDSKVYHWDHLVKRYMEIYERIQIADGK